MKSIIRFVVVGFALLLCGQANAQLSDKELDFLAQKVKRNYAEYGIDGTQVYQTSRNRVLVSIALVSSDMKPAMQNRQAQVKATRSAVEFLNGAINQSINVYEAFSDERSSLSESEGSHVNQTGQSVNSGTAVNASESSLKSDRETMSDKVVQSSLAQIDGMQPLFKMNTDEGIVYAYYIIISKKTAKKKH